MRDLPNFDSRIVNVASGCGEVAAVESDGFTDPHTGGHQQPNQGFMCGRGRPRIRSLCAPVISASMSSGLKMNGS